MATLKPGKVSTYQERVYTALRQIPRGKISTYKALSAALGSSPRAVGGALRSNTFPEVPCHRIISSSSLIGGSMGDKVPSGMNVAKKRKRLEEEGVFFDEKGKLVDVNCFWDEFVVPNVVKETRKKLKRQCDSG